MYYNTTNENAKQVLTFTTHNKKQDEIVIDIINYLNKPFSAKDIHAIYPTANVPLTSIRRSINTLLNNDKIIKTGVKVLGLYGRDVFQYKKNIK